MSYFWQGPEVGPYELADARYQGGRIYLGQRIGPMDAADARFMSGRLWLGPMVGPFGEADARFQDGYVFRGPRVLAAREAAARYVGGRVFAGPEARRYETADGRWEGIGGGVAGAVLLCFFDSADRSDRAHHAIDLCDSSLGAESRRNSRGCACGETLETPIPASAHAGPRST